VSLDSYGGNIIENVGCTLRTRIGVDLTPVSPGFYGDLQERGGFTFVYPISESGRAVDMIDAGSTLRCVGTDQRGVARSIDGNGDGDADCDPGAYEFES